MLKMSKQKINDILKTLGNKDCKQCGYETCLELAKAIEKGIESVSKCVYLVNVTLTIDGKDIVIKEFVQNFIAGSIIGMITTLQGVPGNFKSMEIKIIR